MFLGTNSASKTGAHLSSWSMEDGVRQAICSSPIWRWKFSRGFLLPMDPGAVCGQEIDLLVVSPK